MLLALLGNQERFKVDVLLPLFVVNFEPIKDLVHLIHNMRVAHHTGTVHSDEVMHSQVIGQVCKDEGSLFCFLN